MKWFLTASAIALSTPAMGQECIDDELVLLADASQSMDGKPYKLQREGYANAFRTQRVMDQIRAGGCQAIAVTYVEFASSVETVVGWTIISNEVQAELFAKAIEAAPRPDIGHMTNLAAAMEYGARQILDNDITAQSQIVDVSSDGQPTDGPHPSIVRDKYTDTNLKVWERVTFNGLPIARGGYNAQSISEYFQKHIVGGPRSQLFPAADINNFSDAVARKISREIG